MSLWKYIGEFLLFRRLFGSGRHGDSGHGSSSLSQESFRRPDPLPDDFFDAQDDFLDEQDEYDMLDDDF